MITNIQVQSYFQKPATVSLVLPFLKSSVDFSRLCWAQFNEYWPLCRISPQKRWLYEDVFHSDFNLAFQAPKKDQCGLCYRFEHSSPEQQATLKPVYENHHRRNDEARAELDRCKVEAFENPMQFHSITMDLEKVLLCPHVEVKDAFYKRKLSVYNFTVCSQANNQGYCFYWSEIDGKKGSAEIASCLFDYLQRIPETTRIVSIFSDTCGGQNRNITVRIWR